MTRHPKIWSAKVGTIPMLIVLRYNYNLEIGNVVWFRDKDQREWHKGRIEDIHTDIWKIPCWLRLSRV